MRKLHAFTRLSGADEAELMRISGNVRLVEPRRDLICEGDNPDHVHWVLGGWACRYKMLPDGKRQIVGLCLPGDLCDLNVYLLKQMDHSIGAVTSLRVAVIAAEEMSALTADRPSITKALLWNELVSAAVQREWLLNIGQRGAYERVAHLLAEVFIRLRVVGLTNGESCDFPLTQNDLADATGLTSVHVNRMLQFLRRDRLIELDRRRLRILDLPRLMNAAMFNPNYLHLDREGAQLDAK